MAAADQTGLAGENYIWLAAFTGLVAVYFPALNYLSGALLLDPYYSHGFVIPMVSLFIAWTSRRRLSLAARSTERHPLYPLVISITLYAIAFVLDFRFLMYVCFVVSLGGLILFIWGTDVLKILAFPLAYLFLMLPLPYSVTSAVAFPLQLASSSYATVLLNLLGISALQEGVNIHIPGFSFVIEKGCSGLHSIVALFTLAVLFAYLIKGPLRKKVFLVFSSLPIALMANLIRIVVVIIVARIWGRATAESFFHLFSSIFLFCVAFLLFLATARFIGCLQPRR